MSQPDHARLMDGIYQYQRHIYDITRKYYLLGRDQLIADMAPQAGETVLEVGCGTARNLIAAAKRYPDAKYYGFDISQEMLITARRNIEKAGLSDVITVTEGDASAFASNPPFEIRTFDKIFYSYCLSMIPPWKEAIEQGLQAIKPNGSVHIVDFGDQEKQPNWAKFLLKKWLAIFQVEPRKELSKYLREITNHSAELVVFRSLYRGYTSYARIELVRNTQNAA